MSRKDGHIYLRHLDPEGESSLAKIARRIPHGSIVLDLGAGPGVLGKYLAEEKGCVVDGVEYHPTQVAMASPFYRRLVDADLESADLAAIFSDSRYDFIVCADILEHLKDPGRIIEQLPPLLAPTGRVLVSIPNVGYAGLVADLLAGNFDYRTEGLQDATHLRFFTRNSLLSFLDRHGLFAAHIDPVALDLKKSEFAARHPGALPPAIYRHLFAAPDAFSYQFIVEAAPKTEGFAGVPLEKPAPAESFFSCAVRWRERNGVEGEKSALGLLGKSHQTISFELPGGIEALTFVPADRPGYLAFHGLRLFSKSGECLWSWHGDLAAIDSRLVQEMYFAHAWFGGFRVVALLTGENPSMGLDIPPEILSRTHRLEAEISWPMSTDYLALAERFLRPDVQFKRISELEERHIELQGKHMALHGHHAALQEQHTALQEQHAALHGQYMVLREQYMALSDQHAVLHGQFSALGEQHAALGQQHAALSEQHAALGERAGRIEEETALLKTQVASLQNMLTTAQNETSALRQLIATMEATKIWRYSRPLVRALIALKGGGR